MSSASSAVSGGSSPHPRGAPSFACSAWFSFGIIPVYAGSTRRLPKPCIRPWDHPRIRGEHYGVDWGFSTDPGSSPHTRGARALGDAYSNLEGIIPAYAGSTRQR